MHSLTNTVIITAGGSGQRMGSSIPKQFILMNHKAILQYSIETFYEFDADIQILVTLPKSWFPYWKEYCIKNDFTIEHQLVDGGKERFHSIQNALKFAKGKLIAVHDGVRPLIDLKTIGLTFTEAARSGAAIPVIPVTQSIRKIENGTSRALNRKDYVLIQTPQVFEQEILRKAYELEYEESITDDASLVEKTGQRVSLVEGNEKNLKITTQIDILLAEQLL